MNPSTVYQWEFVKNGKVIKTANATVDGADVIGRQLNCDEWRIVRA